MQSGAKRTSFIIDYTKEMKRICYGLYLLNFGKTMNSVVAQKAEFLQNQNKLNAEYITVLFIITFFFQGFFFFHFY